MAVHPREFRSTLIGRLGKKLVVSVRKLTIQTVPVNVDHVAGKGQHLEVVAVENQVTSVTSGRPVLRTDSITRMDVGSRHVNLVVPGLAVILCHHVRSFSDLNGHSIIVKVLCSKMYDSFPGCLTIRPCEPKCCPSRCCKPPPSKKSIHK